MLSIFVPCSVPQISLMADMHVHRDSLVQEMERGDAGEKTSSPQKGGNLEVKSAFVAQVVLLDPVLYPSAIKAFAREICRNDLLNFGRLHFFFPDSRLSLDLNTDKALKVLKT